MRDFPGGSDGKESACSAGDPCLMPGLGRSPGEGGFLLGKFSGQRSLVGSKSMGLQGSDTTEQLILTHVCDFILSTI